MKRKLSNEALYQSEKPIQQRDPTAKRLRKSDPDGKKGLKLLEEIENQRKTVAT